MSSKTSMSSSSNNSINCVVGDSGNLLQTYRLTEKLCLTVAQGSVVDFCSQKGAIVNAANEECLGGGGVDGAISKAGGQNLFEDRYNLPRIRGQHIRCPTGDAKLTGPGDYGDLGVPYVIHAVGPNYYEFDEENDVETPHSLLRSAYHNAMEVTLKTQIQKVGFSLLSAGVFRGDQSLATVLAIGIEAIRDWSKDESKMETSEMEDVVLFAFTDREANTLVRVCDEVLGESAHVGPPRTEENGHTEKEETNSIDDNDDEAIDDNDVAAAVAAEPPSQVSEGEKVEETCEAEKMEEKTPPTGSETENVKYEAKRSPSSKEEA